jgi:hypothetical protein
MNTYQVFKNIVFSPTTSSTFQTQVDHKQRNPVAKAGWALTFSEFGKSVDLQSSQRQDPYSIKEFSLKDNSLKKN